MGIEILERSCNLDESDRESLLMMKGASEFMADTLNDVLSMQKIEEGKLELDLGPFSMSDAINKVFATFHGAVITKNISLVKVVASNVPPKVVGDRYRIEHVISNLLSNAIKFSAENKTVEVEVTAGAVKDTDEGPQVVITVAVVDEGPGISAENQRKLFGNFVQIRPGQLQQGQGSGLGLSLCKQLVNLHGGTIGLSSTEGRGSVFHFSVPFLVYGGSGGFFHPPLESDSANNHSTTVDLALTSYSSTLNEKRASAYMLKPLPVMRADMVVLVVDGEC